MPKMVPKELAELATPEKYRWVPQGRDSRYNIARLYARLAEGIRSGKPISPGFDAAVTRHRLLDAVVRASETGMKRGLRTDAPPQRSALCTAK
jgi:predicted dehydrogenase